MAANELRFAQFSQVVLRPDSNVGIFGDEEPKLIGKVDIRLVVGCCGQQDHAALVLAGCTPESRDNACPRGFAGCGFRQ